MAKHFGISVQREGIELTVRVMEPGRSLAPASVGEDCIEQSSVASWAERVETLFADLPDGYKADEGARQKSDSWTYGEISTSDILKLAEQARNIIVRHPKARCTGADAPS